jgi:hypothetical protein
VTQARASTNTTTDRSLPNVHPQPIEDHMLIAVALVVCFIVICGAGYYDHDDEHRA